MGPKPDAFTAALAAVKAATAAADAARIAVDAAAAAMRALNAVANPNAKIPSTHPLLSPGAAADKNLCPDRSRRVRRNPFSSRY